VGKTEYSLDVYSKVDSITGNLLEQYREEMGEILEAELGIDFHPMDTDPGSRFQMESANRYMRASFGISSVLADEYSGPQDKFFQRRADDFEGFLRKHESGQSGHTTEQLIQYANLYETIAEEEDIDLDINPDLLAIEKKRSIKEKVTDALEEFDEKLRRSETEKLA